MKEQSRLSCNRWLAMTCSMLLLGVVGAGWHLHHPPAPPPVLPAKIATDVPPAVLPRGFAPQLTSSPVLLTATAEQSATPEAPRSELDKMRARVMQSHPDIAQYRHLQRKVLLRPEERDTLRGIYQDEQVLAAAKHDLLAEHEKTFSEDRQFQRLYRVEFLGMGLEWKENPGREQLLSTTKELILAKNIQNDQELELRRSLAGDKVELFMILLHNDRAQAEQLLADAQGTDLEKLLVYARNRYDVLQRMGLKG